MNKIFSEVWNKSLGQIVVASELASNNSAGSAGTGRGTLKPRQYDALAAALALLLLGFSEKSQASYFIATNGQTGTATCSSGGSSGTAGRVATQATTQQSVDGNGTYSAVFGDPSTVSGNYSHSIGNNNTVANNNSFVVGNQASGAVAIGNGDTAIGQGSVALCDTATASASNGVAISSGAKATNAGDVALGAGSTTSAAVAVSSAMVNGVTYGGFAGTAPTSAVSIGSAGNERQLQNVAAGQITATSTDAVNGSQPYSAASEVGQISTSVSTLNNQVTQNTGDIKNLQNGSARTVADELQRHGVPSGKLMAEGRGKHDPVAECSERKRTALIACLAPNRRVEVKASGGK
jgi:autotransporter adhesin